MTTNPGVKRAKCFVFLIDVGGVGDCQKCPNCQNWQLKTSVSPCLRGELSACFSTQLHRDAQAEKGEMSSYNRKVRANSQQPGANS